MTTAVISIFTLFLLIGALMTAVDTVPETATEVIEIQALTVDDATFSSPFGRIEKIY
jgi:hypothetical protein